MPTFLELEQLLDIALTSPDAGIVNFNILRVFLHEILQHLNIANKVIDIDAIASELKFAYDLIKDGRLEVSPPAESPLGDRPHTEPSKRPRVEFTVVRPQTEPADKLQIENEKVQENLDVEQGGEKEPQVMVVESEPSESPEVAEKNLSPTPSVKDPSVKDPSEKDPSVKDPSVKDPSVKDPSVKDPSVKDPSATSRSSVTLLRRSDSLKSLKKRVGELQERVEVLECQPDPIRSVASLVRKESKTPAHDFVELVNIKQKVDACENSLEGLTEMVDALTADVDELKENLRKKPTESFNDIHSDIAELRKSLNAMKGDYNKQDGGQDNETSKQMGNLEYIERRMDGIENMLANLKEDMAVLTKRAAKTSDQEEGTHDLPSTVSQALKRLDTHEDQLQELENQTRELKKELTGADEKASEVGRAANDALATLEVCKVRINDIEDKQAVFEKELKNQKSLIEDNEMQIHQLKNTWILMKRDSLDRVNEEAEKKQGSITTSNRKVFADAAEVETPATRRPSRTIDRDELSLIRSMIFDLQEEKDKLRETDIRLSDELYKKQRHLDDLYSLVDELRDVKADKELLNMGFELKADKKELDVKIGREDFEHYMSLIDQSLRDLLQRLDGHEDALRHALEGINSDVGRKLDKEEVEPLKHYLEARMESMKPKPVEKPPPEEFAAGIRRQLLIDHNCISCDRPLKYAKEEAFPALPTISALPGSKFNRPYTTFELEQIRQHMLREGLGVGKERFVLLERQRTKLQKELLRLSGARNLQELAEVTARACGGIHTLTYPHSQAVVRGLQLNGEFDFLVPEKDLRPVDILGQDGHIYKGLLDSLPPTLPRIPQKNKSHGTKNPPRSTTPSSAKAQNSAADELESA